MEISEDMIQSAEKEFSRQLEAICRDDIDQIDIEKILYAGLNAAWRPIKSAPKTGEQILARSKCDNSCFVVFWGNAQEESGALPGLPAGATIQKDWLLSGSDSYNSLLYAPDEWKPGALS